MELMAIPKKVSKFVDQNGAKAEKVEHRTVYTAKDKASTLKVPLKSVGKTLVVKLGKDLALVLVPSNKNVDKQKLKKLAQAKKVDFATERLIKSRFKGVKLGSVPPFGKIFKMPVYVDKSLLKENKVYLNSGDYRWSFKTGKQGIKKLMPDAVYGSFTKARV